MIRSEGLPPLSCRKKASHAPVETEKETEEFLANLSFQSQFFWGGMDEISTNKETNKSIVRFGILPWCAQELL